jgi:hypothetical protein
MGFNSAFKGLMTAYAKTNGGTKLPPFIIGNYIKYVGSVPVIMAPLDTIR